MEAVHEIKSNIPAFLAKLWNMVNDESTDPVIAWNTKGTGFVIEDQAKFTYQLLPAYYKHNNMSSFVRQLNMYGFHKTSTLDSPAPGGDEVHFFHPCFQKDSPELLKLIRRKTTGPPKAAHPESASDGGEEYIRVLTDVRVLKSKQKSVDSQLSAMKAENTILWRELAMLRQKHEKQQQIVNKLIQFLVTIVRPPAHMGGLGVKRQYPLMLKERPMKRMKPATPGSETTDGPTIHELDNEIMQDSLLAEQANEDGNQAGEQFDNPELVDSSTLYDIFSPEKSDDGDGDGEGVLLNPASQDTFLSDLMNGNYNTKTIKNNEESTEDMRVVKREGTRSLSRLNSIEDFDSHVETTQNELEQLKDLLQGCTSFDATALFGLFTDESPSYGLGSKGDDSTETNPLSSSQLMAYESGVDLNQLLRESIDDDVPEIYIDKELVGSPGGPMLSADIKENK